MSPRNLLEAVAEKRKFHTLDGMRGVAAICVAMIHYQPYLKPIAIHSGYLAVDLFFLMSGFVISYAYGENLSKIGPLRFAKIRIARLYPLYLLGILIAASVSIVGVAAHMSGAWTLGSLSEAVIPELLMLPSPPISGHSDYLYVLNYPAWSLFFEVCVNIAYAAVAKYLDARRILIVLVLSAAAVAWVVLAIGSSNGGLVWSNMPIGFVRVTFSFFCGMAMLLAYRANRLPSISAPPIVTLTLSAVLLMVEPGTALRPYYDLLCVLCLFPLVVCMAVNRDPIAGIKAYTVLGIISYPLYAIHVPCSYFIDRFIARILRGDMTSYAPVAGLGMLLSLCAVSYLLAITYDVRARAALRRIMDTGGRVRRQA